MNQTVRRSELRPVFPDIESNESSVGDSLTGNKPALPRPGRQNMLKSTMGVSALRNHADEKAATMLVNLKRLTTQYDLAHHKSLPGFVPPTEAEVRAYEENLKNMAEQLHRVKNQKIRPPLRQQRPAAAAVAAVAAVAVAVATIADRLPHLQHYLWNVNN